MPALFAFLHHLAAFALVGALAVQFVLVRDPLTPAATRRMIAADAVLGGAATLLLAVGLLRVFFFEKGAGYYFQNAAFLLKLALFLGLAVASLRVTRVLAGWRRSLAAGGAPEPPAGQAAALRRIIHLELAGVAVILLCAALMARGIGGF